MAWSSVADEPLQMWGCLWGIYRLHHFDQLKYKVPAILELLNTSQNLVTDLLTKFRSQKKWNTLSGSQRKGKGFFRKVLGCWQVAGVIPAHSITGVPGHSSQGPDEDSDTILAGKGHRTSQALETWGWFMGFWPQLLWVQGPLEVEVGGWEQRLDISSVCQGQGATEL